MWKRLGSMRRHPCVFIQFRNRIHAIWMRIEFHKSGMTLDLPYKYIDDAHTVYKSQSMRLFYFRHTFPIAKMRFPLHFPNTFLLYKGFALTLFTLRHKSQADKTIDIMLRRNGKAFYCPPLNCEHEFVATSRNI